MKVVHGVMLLLLCALVPVAAAADATPRNGQWQDWEYVVFETRGGGDQESLPLVIALHSSGSQPEELASAFADLPVRARVVLPRGPFPRPSGRSWFPEGYGALPASAQAAVTEAAESRLTAFIQQMQERHPTRGRPLLTGVSYGGDLSLLLILHHPDAYTAAFPVAARLLPEWQQSAVDCADACPPILALHGRDDRTVPMAPTETALQALGARGWPVSMRGYEHTAHDFSPAMQADVRQAIADRFRAMTGDANMGKLTPTVDK
ncbi:alpha/beta hydrolase [Pseudoxanthomonas indica]|uniref:Phospholipase/carboxylesterase n=1 Tax=Pseudoxanthomonas indica TaxID=428993 RepID=A0A1T5JXS5_9GAMM|nr:dienelactone hydrolase family protein [Pseudoxanthomonas indica]GGD45164.1 hypothetical protein GCM10007235_16350 [Pseudoxanthomonas indica]SKC56183.1 phospholipase/carboxylesterase [Pseudoxanthomonas indica]